MEYTDILWQVVVGVIGVLIALALPFFLKKGFDFLSLAVKAFEENNPSAFDAIYFFAVEAVAYAEQAGLLKEAEEKKDMAIAYVQRELDERGIKVDVEVISDKIEAALFIEWNQFKKEIEELAG